MSLERRGEGPVGLVSRSGTLYFSSNRPGGLGQHDIYRSRRVDGRWTAPENLGPNVNGPGDEHHSIPTSDSRSLYVTAMRDGGYGDDDTYITTRDANGKWGPLVNLGPLINGPGDDRCPAWTPGAATQIPATPT